MIDGIGYKRTLFQSVVILGGVDVLISLERRRADTISCNLTLENSQKERTQGPMGEANIIVQFAYKRFSFEKKCKSASGFRNLQKYL